MIKSVISVLTKKRLVMRNLLMLSFFSLLLLSSCADNESNGDADTGNGEMKNESTTAKNDADNNMNSSDNNPPADRNAWNDDFKSMFNVTDYTEDEVREYRRMHDENDWGLTPGYYPEGSTRELTQEDIQYLTTWGHKIMMNEIYARHGKKFDNQELRTHFSQFEWYDAQHDNVQDMLSQTEQNNIEFLKNNQPS